MRAIGRFFSRIFFWAYERGTAPYDVAVAAILVFVLLTPRGWFHDRPQTGTPPQDSSVVQIGDDETAGTQTYRVDVRALALPIPETELEHLLHDAVRKYVPDLKGRTFQIVHFTQILGQNGTVIGYEVSIKP
jgi:hypothetical protein